MSNLFDENTPENNDDDQPKPVRKKAGLKPRTLDPRIMLSSTLFECTDADPEVSADFDPAAAATDFAIDAVSDGSDLFTSNVNEGNTAPDATDDLVLTHGGFLRSVADFTTDVDGDDLSFSVVEGPENGSLEYRVGESEWDLLTE